MFKWRVLAMLLLIAALSGGVYLLLHTPLNGLDDANIFFVYARNLVSGHGVVFYPGGEHVEGFTSTLWLGIISLVFWIAPLKPEKVLVAVSIAILACSFPVLIWQVEKTLQRRTPGTPQRFISKAAILLCTWIFASPVFLSWTVVSMMDVGIMTALFILAAADLLALPSSDPSPFDIARSCAIIILFLLARPEGIAYGAVYWIFRWAVLPLSLNRAVKIRNILIALGVYVLGIAILTSFRLMYFGWPFPNTFYAKVSPNLAYDLSQGLKYLSSFILDNPMAGVLLGLIFFRTCWFFRYLWTRNPKKIQENIGEMGVYTLVGAGLILPVLTGGDHFSFYRFYQPVYALLPVGLLFWLYENYTFRKTPAFSQRIYLALIAALMLLYTNPNWLSFSSQITISQEYTLAENGRRIGDDLNAAFKNLPSYPSVGEITVGGIAYGYRGAVIDLMGLNNVAMGHSAGERIGKKNHAAFNKDVFYQLNPQMLLPREVAGPEIPEEYLGCGPHSSFNRDMLKDLPCEAAFAAEYEQVLFATNPEKQPPYLVAYVRKDTLADIERQGIPIILVNHLNPAGSATP